MREVENANRPVTEDCRIMSASNAGKYINKLISNWFEEIDFCGEIRVDLSKCLDPFDEFCHEQALHEIEEQGSLTVREVQDDVFELRD